MIFKKEGKLCQLSAMFHKIPRKIRTVPIMLTTSTNEVSPFLSMVVSVDALI